MTRWIKAGDKDKDFGVVWHNFSKELQSAIEKTEKIIIPDL